MDINVNSERSEKNGHNFISVNGIKLLNYGFIGFNDGKCSILTKLVASEIRIVGEKIAKMCCGWYHTWLKLEIYCLIMSFRSSSLWLNLTT